MDTTSSDTTDVVNHPAHYTAYDGVEVIDLTQHLNFCRGNAVKYIARAGLKSAETELEDLRKAQWYLEREISRVERERESTEARINEVFEALFGPGATIVDAEESDDYRCCDDCDGLLTEADEEPEPEAAAVDELRAYAAEDVASVGALYPDPALDQVIYVTFGGLR